MFFAAQKKISSSLEWDTIFQINTGSASSRELGLRSPCFFTSRVGLTVMEDLDLEQWTNAPDD